MAILSQIIYTTICSITSTFFFGLTAAAANMLLMLDGFESGALMLGFFEALSFLTPLRPEAIQNRIIKGNQRRLKI